jgi:hypothetical protein
MKFVVSLLFFCFIFLSKAQERLGLTSGNYCGINNVFLNPASSAHTPFQLDVNFGTIDAFFNNRLLNIPTFTNANFNNGSVYFSPSLPPFKYGSLDARLWTKLPSLAVRFDNFSVGIFSNFRANVMARNFPIELAQKFRGGFDPTFSGEIYPMKQHEVGYLWWRESGVNLSRTIRYFKNERVYFGMNLKFLDNANGFYLGSNGTYDVKIVDSLNYFLPSYGGLYARGNNGSGFSADMGIKFVKFQRGESFVRERNENEKLFANYFFSAGISLTDFGWVKFSQNAVNNNFYVENLNVQIDTTILNNQTGPDFAAYLQGVLGNLSNNISQNNSGNQPFLMQLPTTLGLQGDYQPISKFYVNANLRIPMRFSNHPRISGNGIISITPRLETNKFMVALPLSLYKWREPTIGLAVRYRGFTLGSDVLSSGNRTEGFDHFNFYASFKISIEEMEHSFLKPPVPPFLHMITDTVPLPEGGYVGKISFNPGETIKLYYSRNTIKSDSFSIRPLEKDTTIAKVLCAARPQKVRRIKPWKNGFGYSISSLLKLASLKSGIYLFDNRIPFIIKPKESKHEILVVVPTNEFAANNMSGGKGLHAAKKRRKPANVISFNRPENVTDYEALVPLIKFFNSDTSWHVGFIAEKDLENSVAFSGVRLLIIAGNSSHWTRRARTNFDKYLDKGGNALVFSENFMKWQVRYRQKGTQMICHKRKFTDLIQDPYLKTTTWDEPSLKYPRPIYLNTTVADFSSFATNSQDDSLLNKLEIPFKLVNPLSKSIAERFGILNFSEKSSQQFIAGFGDSAINSTPFILVKRKPQSGFYIQSSNVEFLRLNAQYQRNVVKMLLNKFSGVQE